MLSIWSLSSNVVRFSFTLPFSMTCSRRPTEPSVSCFCCSSSGDFSVSTGVDASRSAAYNLWCGVTVALSSTLSTRPTWKWISILAVMTWTVREGISIFPDHSDDLPLIDTYSGWPIIFLDQRLSEGWTMFLSSISFTSLLASSFQNVGILWACWRILAVVLQC